MKRDMTEGSVIRAITLFAIPLFIGAVFQQVYNMVDTMVVGNFVSSTALGAVGTCGGTFNLIISLLTGLSGGTGVLMAQQFGAGDMDTLKRSFISSILLNVLVGVILTVLGVCCSRFLVVTVLGTPEEQIQDAVTYLTIMCAGIMANCLYNGMAAVLRAMGDSITPLIALLTASALNIGLDLLFVIGFHWGVAGVAFATVLSQLLSAIASIVYTFLKMKELRFGIHELRWDKELVSELCRIGIPSALSSAGVSISVMFMQRAINSFGATVVSGYTIGNKAESICMCLAYSIGIATGTFCGQNIGARKYDRVRSGMRIGSLIAVLYAAVMTAVCLLFAHPLAGLFSKDQDVIDVAVEVIYITMSFAPVLGLVFIFQNFLRSAGDIAPTVWMSVTEIVARSVLAFLFAFALHFGRVGVWWVTPIGWTASLILGFIRYKSGVWKKKALTAKESA